MPGYPESATFTVSTGTGIAGSQSLSIFSNWQYAAPYATYELPTPLTTGSGARRISVMLDPSYNDPWNFTNFGSVVIGRDWTIYRGVVFDKEDWSYGGGDAPTDFIIRGPGGTFGYFVASAAQNYYKITFDINAEFTSILITVTYPDGTTVTQTTTWDGGDINKIRLSGSDRI